jgi:hypothetical protein
MECQVSDTKADERIREPMLDHDFTHDALVERARSWLLSARRCSVVLTELGTWSTNEIPDALGFTNWHSVLVECKISRSDFFADAKKVFRRELQRGMGNFRFYLCPAGLIKAEEVPGPWGLVYAYLSRARQVKKAVFCEANAKHERAILLSIARRVQGKGLMAEICKPLPRSLLESY